MPNDRRVEPTRTRTYANVVLVLVFTSMLAALPASVAYGVWQTAEWTDRSSDEFELRVGVHGSWNATWDDTGSRERTRRLRILPHVQDDLLPRGTGVQVRVIPVDALVPRSRKLVDGDGWATIGSQSNGIPEPELDPPLVERIEYRVVAVPPGMEGTTARLFVAGRADSVYHGSSAPFFCCALAIVAAPLLSMFAVARRRRTTSSARDGG